MLSMEDQAAPDLRRFYLGHAQVNRAAGSTRRCLFGPANPSETRRFLEGEMREIYEQQKKKWNFDFEREQPVPGGRFVWQRVSPVPERSRTEAVFGTEEPAESAEPVEAAAAPAAAPAQPVDHPADRPASGPSDRPSDRSSSRPARQPAITDMLRTRKRQRVSEPDFKATQDEPAPKRASSSHRDEATM